jgi:hypothetical protein
MIRNLVAGALVLLSVAAVSVSAFAQGDAVQRSFGGDAVRLDLSAGTYRVTASPDDRIRVLPRTKTDQVSTRITVSLFGTRATVRIVGPPDGFEADIQLPARVTVDVSLSGGSVQMNGVGPARSSATLKR